MRPAAERLSQALVAVFVQPLTVGVVTNVEAEVNLDADRVKALLTEQAVRPVLWQECVRKLELLGCRRVLEVGPGKVLTGLTKRISPSLITENFQAAGDLARVRQESSA
jgi:[acyl-carrier-protein] S-malonyltransferase